MRLKSHQNAVICKTLVVNEASQNAIFDPFGVYSPGRGCLPLSRRLANRGDSGRPQMSGQTPCMSLGEYGSLGVLQEIVSRHCSLSKVGQLSDSRVDSMHVCLLHAFLLR